MADLTYEDLAAQLSLGLDLCVRARRLDAQERTNILDEAFPGNDLERLAPRMTANFPPQPYLTRSATIAVWVQDQYDTDLLKWETDTRAMLSRLPFHAMSQPKEPGQ